MPELVAEVEHPPAVIGAEQLAVEVDVRDVGHLLVLQPLLVDIHHAAGLLQRAERLAEGHLLVVVQLLVAEDEDGIAVHRPVDLGAEGRVRRLAQVDALDFGSEQRV